MDQSDDAILTTVMEVVVRYGMKRTTMGDIAQAAGVSRQTLYDRYGDKDGIMAAAIGFWGRGLCARLTQALEAAPDLAGKIDAYFDTVVWPYFETRQAMPDAADLERGLGPASKSASHEVETQKQALLQTAFAGFLPPAAPPPQAVARYFEQASGRAKMSDIDRDDLAAFLAVLKASTLALARLG